MTIREIFSTKEAENVCKALSEYKDETSMSQVFEHIDFCNIIDKILTIPCLLYTSPSPRD